MTLIARSEDLKKLWTILLPGIPVPSDLTFVRWASEFEPAQVERGITRAAAKLRAGTLRLDSAERYVTSVAANERRQAQEETFQESNSPAVSAEMGSLAR